MPLDAKDSAAPMPNAFNRLIVSIQVTRLKPCPIQGPRPDCVAVVLSGDEASSSLEIYAWMVHSAMTEFQLVRLCSRSKGENLSPKAYPHYREAGLHQC